HVPAQPGQAGGIEPSPHAERHDLDPGGPELAGQDRLASQKGHAQVIPRPVEGGDQAQDGDLRAARQERREDVQDPDARVRSARSAPDVDPRALARPDPPRGGVHATPSTTRPAGRPATERISASRISKRRSQVLRRANARRSARARSPPGPPLSILACSRARANSSPVLASRSGAPMAAVSSIGVATTGSAAAQYSYTLRGWMECVRSFSAKGTIPASEAFRYAGRSAYGRGPRRRTFERARRGDRSARCGP